MAGSSGIHVGKHPLLGKSKVSLTIVPVNQNRVVWSRCSKNLWWLLHRKGARLPWEWCAWICFFSDKGWDGRNQRDKKTEGKGNGPWKDLKHLSALNENLCLGCRCWVNIRQVPYEAQCLYKDLNVCSLRDIASVYHSGNLSNRISHPSDAWSWSLSWLLWRSASEGPPHWEWFVWTVSL